MSWPAAVDGVNLAKTKDRDAVFLEYFAKQKWVNPIRTIRTRRWKLNVYRSGNRELYDIRADPSETSDHSRNPAYKKLVAELESRIDSWWTPE